MNLAVRLTGCLAAALLPLSAVDPPPLAPTNVRGVEATAIDARTGSFVIEFTPASINKTVLTRYQFGAQPKFCRFPETTPGESSFPTATFPASGPFRTRLVCVCGKTYTPIVTTAPLTAGGPRSIQAKGTTVTVPCNR